MARNSNTFEKLRRERLKKQKADDKRARRQKKKQDAEAAANPEPEDPITPAEEPSSTENTPLDDC